MHLLDSSHQHHRITERWHRTAKTQSQPPSGKKSSRSIPSFHPSLLDVLVGNTNLVFLSLLIKNNEESYSNRIRRRILLTLLLVTGIAERVDNGGEDTVTLISALSIKVILQQAEVGCGVAAGGGGGDGGGGVAFCIVFKSG
ncbi:hypothetical protein Fcan01_22645 [Folsomia candida]|uniref:Uncharacterized protein n=1 Tax=Folsomia candida TaxID=158441 RepID=A0A226DD53_FOLCA|nr:hypothetical protein Fcan01_22645 [Folsomia candida]